MDSDKFLPWFTQELQNLENHSKETEMFEKCRHLINEAIVRLDELLPEERLQIHYILANYSSNSYMIGNYQIPYDERDTFDYLEEVLGTVEAYLRN